MKTGALNSKDIKAICIDGARGNVACIQNGRGTLVSVQYGAVWITQSGSPVDACLNAGESFCIDRDGLTLISALGDAPRALVHLSPSNRIAPSAANRLARSFSRLRAPWRSTAGLV